LQEACQLNRGEVNPIKLPSVNELSLAITAPLEIEVTYTPIMPLTLSVYKRNVTLIKE
jgi:hypothetical protein